MSEPFLSEIRMMGFNFAPRGWAKCDGQLLPINQNQALYSLLGTTYGGDGRTSFGLPGLRGRTPIHVGRAVNGAEHRLGQKGGQERHTLTTNEITSHQHALQASTSPATLTSPVGNLLAVNPYRNYTQPGALTALKANVTYSGGGQSHENMQPFQVVNFCIALQGLFPSRN